MSEEQRNTRNAANEQQQQQQQQQQAKQLTEEQQLVADAVDEAIRMEAAAAQASSSSARSSDKGKGPAMNPPAAATSTPNGSNQSMPSLGSDSEFVTITSSQEGSRILLRYWDLCVWDAWLALVQPAPVSSHCRACRCILTRPIAFTAWVRQVVLVTTPSKAI